MKAQARFLGVDDAPFTFTDGTVRLVGVVTRGPSYVEGVLSRRVAVDGSDATGAIAAMALESRFAPTLRAVFLNGIAVGGFNVVDVEALHAALRVPVVAVARREPDVASIRAALKAHFPDWKVRWDLVARATPRAVRNGRFTVWVSARGVPEDALEDLLEKSTVRGAIPEPIRLAHVIASGIERGESRGKT